MPEMNEEVRRQQQRAFLRQVKLAMNIQERRTPHERGEMMSGEMFEIIERAGVLYREVRALKNERDELRERVKELKGAAFDAQDRIGGYIERVKELEKEKIEGIARDVLQAKVIDTYSEQVKQLEAKAPTLLYETLEMAHKVITEFWKPSDDPEHEEENTAIANALSTIALVLQGDRR